MDMSRVVKSISILLAFLIVAEPGVESFVPNPVFQQEAMAVPALFWPRAPGKPREEISRNYHTLPRMAWQGGQVRPPTLISFLPAFLVIYLVDHFKLDQISFTTSNWLDRFIFSLFPSWLHDTVAVILLGPAAPAAAIIVAFVVFIKTLPSDKLVVKSQPPNAPPSTPQYNTMTIPGVPEVRISDRYVTLIDPASFLRIFEESLKAAGLKYKPLTVDELLSAAQKGAPWNTMVEILRNQKYDLSGGREGKLRRAFTSQLSWSVPSFLDYESALKWIHKVSRENRETGVRGTISHEKGRWVVSITKGFVKIDPKTPKKRVFVSYPSGSAKLSSEDERFFRSSKAEELIVMKDTPEVVIYVKENGTIARKENSPRIHTRPKDPGPRAPRRTPARPNLSAA
jgi:hypothetical protein